MPTRVSGINSGMDTEALVSAMVMNYQAKATKSQKAQTKLQYKMDALKSVNSDVYSLFSSVDKMRWSSAYSLKSTTVSDPTKAKVTASDTAVNGTQTLKIDKLAQAGYLTGGNVKGKSALSTGSKLSDIYSESKQTNGSTVKNEFAGGSISVTVGGKERNIALTESMTAQDFVNELKSAGLNASFDANNGRFFISSKESGVDNDFKLVANDSNGLASLKALGLYSADSDTMSEYQKWADYENMSSDEWDAFVDSQYKSSAISYEARAKSYATQYNSAVEAKEKAQKNAAEVFETLKDKDGNDIVTDAASAKAYADGLKSARDTNSLYDDYRTNGTDDEGNPTVSYDLSAMEQAVKDGKLTQEALDQFKETEADIKKFEDAATKLEGYEKTMAESDTKVAELAGKVYLDTVDGKTKAVALTAENDATAYENLKTEVDTDNANARAALEKKLQDRITESKDMLATMTAGGLSDGAVRIKAADARIFLNGAEFTSSKNNFSINGLSIEATALTDGEITITTNTDTQGIYDKIKDFLQQYNDVINKITKLYNAESAKGYEPLTEDEKDKLSDTEVAKWESKIKDAILRRDGTIGGIMNSMTSAMTKGFEIDGKTYNLQTFGISTLGLFGSKKNEQYAYHIDGDADDSDTSGKKDKLMAAIMAEPDKVMGFFQKLSSSLYDSLNAKMKSSSLSSAYTIYNDKEMASEYSNYTKTVSKWQDKVSKMEDMYFKKFAAMEKTLAKLNSQTSSMSSFLGG